MLATVQCVDSLVQAMNLICGEFLKAVSIVKVHVPYAVTYLD